MIKMDDVANGLVALIHDHHITNLVMGDASDRNCLESVLLIVEMSFNFFIAVG